jgi:hypothetical protein
MVQIPALKAASHQFDPYKEMASGDEKRDLGDRKWII